MNPRIVSDIVALLDEQLPPYLYALDFTTKHYADLLTLLSAADNEELFNDKKGAIQKALLKYFAKSHQTVDLSVSFTTFSLNKHFTDPSRSESFDRMVHRNAVLIMDIYERKSDFLPLPYLVSIPADLRTQIMESFSQENEPIETARQTTRQQIDTIFNLDEKDIVFFLRGKISIRYYTPPKKLPSGADKRFAGESIEMMEAMYRHYFPKGAWEEIEPILDEVIAEKLHFSYIDNLTFSKTFIPIFRSMVEILLLDILSEADRDKLEGLTGYVLRQYFHKILLFTAKNLLSFIENRDKNAEFFVKYFTDDVIIDENGNKIQKYAITDTRQQRWNYSSIVSVMMQYKQTKLRISAQQESLLTAQEQLNECQNEIAGEKKYKKEMSEKISEMENIIAENDTKILRCKGQTGTTPEDIVSIKSEIKKANDHHTDLLKMKKSLNTQLELINSRITNKMVELARRQKKLEYEKKSLKTIIEQSASVKEMYELIAEGISLVLAKR